MLPLKAPVYVWRRQRVAEEDLMLIILLKNMNKMLPGFLTVRSPDSELAKQTISEN